MKRPEAAAFSQYYDAKKQRKEISDASIFLIVLGLVLAVVFSLRAIVSEGFAEILSIAAAICGTAFIFLGTVLPQLMAPIVKKISSALNRLGILLLKALLIPVYLLTWVLTFPFAKKKTSAYDFLRWESAPPVRETFFRQAEEKLNERKSMQVIGSIFAGIAAHKLYILIPLIVILLLIGLLFFFLSSSTVFSFIYTFV